MKLEDITNFVKRQSRRMIPLVLSATLACSPTITTLQSEYECAKDMDCIENLVCEENVCVEPVVNTPEQPIGYALSNSTGLLQFEDTNLTVNSTSGPVENALGVYFKETNLFHVIHQDYFDSMVELGPARDDFEVNMTEISLTPAPWQIGPPISSASVENLENHVIDYGCITAEEIKTREGIGTYIFALPGEIIQRVNAVYSFRDSLVWVLDSLELINTRDCAGAKQYVLSYDANSFLEGDFVPSGGLMYNQCLDEEEIQEQCGISTEVPTDECVPNGSTTTTCIASNERTIQIYDSCDGFVEDISCSLDEICQEGTCIEAHCEPEAALITSCVDYDSRIVEVTDSCGTSYDSLECVEDLICDDGICVEELCVPVEEYFCLDVATVLFNDGCGSEYIVESCEEEEVCVTGVCVDEVCIPETTELTYTCLDSSTVTVADNCNYGVNTIDCDLDELCDEAECVTNCDYEFTEVCHEGNVHAQNYCGEIGEIGEECEGFTECRETECQTTLEGKIAFSDGRSSYFQIYVMNGDGSRKTNLTYSSENEFHPSFSSDGSKIAFVSDRADNLEIYVMNADGSEQTNISNGPYTLEDNPSWSPDGSKIAFESRRDGNMEIYSMNVDGSNQTNLTNNTYNDSQPTWSPDGTEIAFYSNRDGNGEIYVMNIDGSEQINITNSPGTSEEYPSWSPDGSQIAYSTAGAVKDIYVMNTDGSEQTNITNNSFENSNPVWSPDGSKIAFVSRRDSNGVYVMNADGSEQTNITSSSANITSPSWTLGE